MFIFLIAVSLFCAGATCAWAFQAEFKAMRELEESQRKPTEEAAIERPRVKFEEVGLKDPFREPIIKRPDKPVALTEEGSKVSQLPTLTVQGLIWGGIFPQAIINNKVLKIGDTIDGARIANISKDGVVVFYEGTQYSLSAPATGIRANKNPEGGLR
ncbi:MAG: hypothetical protein Q8N85_02895 [Candidatus Omnitrophota bacterium]|nr:hypothetical protein [Candidatus Omnitrophota bacterium]